MQKGRYRFPRVSCYGRQGSRAENGKNGKNGTNGNNGRKKASIGLRALSAISLLLLQQHKNMEIADFIKTEIINFQNT